MIERWETEFPLMDAQKDAVNFTLSEQESAFVDENDTFKFNSSCLSDDFKSIAAVANLLTAEMTPAFIEAQKNDYSNTMTLLKTRTKSLRSLESHLEDNVEKLNCLKVQFTTVSSRTNGLKSSCEQLYSEQLHLQSSADYLKENLNFFYELDEISRVLSEAGDEICLNESFTLTVAKLERCIDFTKMHGKWRDSDLYYMRYVQCLTRAMSMVKMHIISAFSKFGVSSTESFTSSSLRFRLISQQLKPFVSTLEERCEKFPEFAPMISDCYNSYFGCRSQILRSQINAFTMRMSQSFPSDIVGLLNECCQYFVTTGLDEYALFYSFFESGEEELVYKSFYLREI